MCSLMRTQVWSMSAGPLQHPEEASLHTEEPIHAEPEQTDQNPPHIPFTTPNPHPTTHAADDLTKATDEAVVKTPMEKSPIPEELPAAVTDSGPTPQPDETGLNLPHVSQQTVERDFVPHHRQVDQQHISDSTVFSSAFRETLPTSGAPPDRHVTQSTMQSFLTDAVAPSAGQHTTKMMVADQHVSKSSVGGLFSKTG